MLHRVLLEVPGETLKTVSLSLGRPLKTRSATCCNSSQSTSICQFQTNFPAPGTSSQKHSTKYLKSVRHRLALISVRSPRIAVTIRPCVDAFHNSYVT